MKYTKHNTYRLVAEKIQTYFHDGYINTFTANDLRRIVDELDSHGKNSIWNLNFEPNAYNTEIDEYISVMETEEELEKRIIELNDREEELKQTRKAEAKQRKLNHIEQVKAEAKKLGLIK